MNFVKSWSEFKEILRRHEVETVTKYVYYYGKSFDKEIELTPDLRLNWLDDIPYFHFGRKTYVCHQGKDLNKRQKENYAKEKNEKCQTDHAFGKAYSKNQTTKKVNCPAVINVTRMYRMPQFKVVPTRKRKIMISRKIKEKLANKDSIAGEEVFMFNLPNSQDHQNHLMGNMAAVIEPIDARVRHFIASKVKNGKCNATVIAELLEVYVSTELGETDKTRRRFYPEMEAIRKIISQAKSNIRTSKIDQENTEMLINSWDTSKCSVFFRPCTENTYDGTEPNDFTDSKLNLLFVYQSEEMKNLYVLYGSNLVLLDATYRTCKYALQLYFLVVKTNVNYQIVSIIITQTETAKALEEALIIIKNWSPLVRPKYGMVDFAMEEITSLENVFTGIKAFICSFHREQAWSRWASKKKNAVVPKEELLCKLRAIANAPTQDEMVAAIEVLKSWNQYEAVKDYFELTWFKEIERWALAYKPNDLFINSNNGVE